VAALVALCVVMVAVVSAAGSNTGGGLCVGRATYQLTFTGRWQTDSSNFPGSPSSSHFSSGAFCAHSSSVSFWKSGAKASPGLTRLAEFGRPDVFMQEMSAQSSSGAVINDSIALLPPIDPLDSYVHRFQLNRGHPLVTSATMLGPTPDWFTGVSGVSLCGDDDNWKEDLSMDLGTWDAGTRDSEEWSLGGPAENGVIHDRSTESPTLGTVMSVSFSRTDRHPAVSNLRTEAGSEPDIKLVKWAAAISAIKYRVEIRRNNGVANVRLVTKNKISLQIVDGVKYSIRVAPAFGSGSFGPWASIQF